MTGLLVALTVVSQVGILATIAVGARRGDHAVTVNGVAVLAVALAPTVAQWALDPALDGVPELAAWAAVAGLLHQFGMLGLYESTGWWDHLTHTVSAALATALVYAVVLVGLAVDGLAAAALTVGAILLLGVAWELVELLARDVGERLGIDPVLVHYGWDDTAKDLVFDLVGALLVVGAGLQLFVPLVEPAAGAAAAVAVYGGGALVVGTLAAGLYLWPTGGLDSR